MIQVKQPKNLQERIFALIRELGMTVGQKVLLVQGMFDKRHVCHLTREQGIILEAYLKSCVESGATPTAQDGLAFSTPPSKTQ